MSLLSRVKRTPRRYASAVLLILFSLQSVPTGHAQSSVQPQAKLSPYAPFVFLIGEWTASPAAGGAAMFVERFQWAGNRSYIQFSVATLAGEVEHQHFEGVLMWNGVNRNLDMLVMLDLNPTAEAQEQGQLIAQPDGSILREIVGVYSEGARLPDGRRAGPEGARFRFRQTFVPVDDTTVRTRVLRQDGEKWVATFPGSDDLVLKRRP